MNPGGKGILGLGARRAWETAHSIKADRVINTRRQEGRCVGSYLELRDECYDLEPEFPIDEAHHHHLIAEDPMVASPAQNAACPSLPQHYASTYIESGLYEVPRRTFDGRRYRNRVLQESIEVLMVVY